MGGRKWKIFQDPEDSPPRASIVPEARGDRCAAAAAAADQGAWVGGLSSRAAAGPVSFEPRWASLLLRALIQGPASQRWAFLCEAWRRSTSFSDFLSRFHVFPERSQRGINHQDARLLLPSVP